MNDVVIGRLKILSPRGWQKFKRKFPHYGELLKELIVKDFENGYVLLEMSRLKTVQVLYEEQRG